MAAIFCGSARLETRHHHFLCNSETGERRKSNRAREGENIVRTEGRDEGREKDRKVRERAEERESGRVRKEKKGRKERARQQDSRKVMFHFPHCLAVAPKHTYWHQQKGNASNLLKDMQTGP